MSTDQATLAAFASLLDTTAEAHEPTVEISSLRRLAARGIPSHPPHLRPTTYSVLLGVLPRDKARWEQERANSRRQYAELAAKFLEEADQAPSPTHPLAPNDRLLDEIAKDVRRTQVHLDFFNQAAPATTADDARGQASSAASSSLTIPPRLRSALARRVDLLSSAGKRSSSLSSSQPSGLATGSRSPTPSVRSDVTARPAEGDDDDTDSSLALPHIPELDFGTSSFDDAPIGGSVDKSDATEPAIAPAPASLSAASAAPARELHSDGLTRILYVFSLVHPHLSYTQGYAELLAPLYWVYAGQGSAPVDAAAADDDDGGRWAEPDAFWAFLALMGEVGEVVKGPGNRPWGEVAPLSEGGRKEMDIQWALSRLSARLKWADETLWQDLKRKSLDPAQPFYSFRWVCTFLSQDIPLPSLLLIWDVILSEPPTSHDSLPKVDLLLDVCTAMLLLIRRPLLRAGRRQSAQSGLWGAVDEGAGEFGPGFVDGMALLQRYPVAEVGVEHIIELALESRQRRILAELNGDGPEDLEAAALAAASTPAPVPSTFSRFFGSHRSTPSLSGAPSQTSAAPSAESVSTYGSSIAKYAEAFRESDTAAALSKRSSNLTAAAVARWEDYQKQQQRLSVVVEDDSGPVPPGKDALRSPPPPAKELRGGSSPRPHFVDPVDADTHPLTTLHLPTSVAALASDPSLPQPPLARTPTKSLQDRLAASLATPSLTPPARSHTRSPSSASKPLLLSSSARPPNSSPAGSHPTPPQTSRPPWASDSPLAKWSPAVDRTTSPPPHFAQSASDSEGSRIPIGGSRRRSSQLQQTPLSPPAPIRTTFLKTTPKAQDAGIKLRTPTAAAAPSPSPTVRAASDLASASRAIPRSPRSKGLGRPESFSSAGGESDADSARSSSRLSRGTSGEGSQRGWTLVDDGGGVSSQPTRPRTVDSTATVLPALERLATRDLDYAGASTSSPQTASPTMHHRTQSSASSLGTPASPMGPRPPRKSSRAAITSSATPVTPRRTRPGHDSSNPSDRDADDEDSTADILDSYGGGDSEPLR